MQIILYVSAALVALSILLVAVAFFALVLTVNAAIEQKASVKAPVFSRTSKTQEPIPEALQAFIDAESEPWARQELQRAATSAYARTRDWAMVEAELRKTVMQPPRTGMADGY
jgi:hypothetical protein